MPYSDPEKQRLYMINYQRNRYADPIKRKVILERMRKKDATNRAAFNVWKSTLKCTRCPENHPSCLEFHHLDPNKKDFELSRQSGKNLDRLKREAEKCIVLCANCHRKEHYAGLA